MNPCKTCPINVKTIYCCGSHPETGEYVHLEINGVTYQACPELQTDGSCGIYATRPEACRMYAPVDCATTITESDASYLGDVESEQSIDAILDELEIKL